MIETLQLSEEFTCGPARLRVDGSNGVVEILQAAETSASPIGS